MGHRQVFGNVVGGLGILFFVLFWVVVILYDKPRPQKLEEFNRQIKTEGDLKFRLCPRGQLVGRGHTASTAYHICLQDNVLTVFEQDRGQEHAHELLIIPNARPY